jgi:DNA (cytosine-5)-methyltransferase 1
VITHYEAALLQDVPETFSWCGSKIEIAKQIGNAVPVGLASAVAKQLRRHLT